MSIKALENIYNVNYICSPDGDTNEDMVHSVNILIFLPRDAL